MGGSFGDNGSYELKSIIRNGVVISSSSTVDWNTYYDFLGGPLRPSSHCHVLMPVSSGKAETEYIVYIIHMLVEKAIPCTRWTSWNNVITAIVEIGQADCLYLIMLNFFRDTTFLLIKLQTISLSACPPSAFYHVKMVCNMKFINKLIDLHKISVIGLC